MKMDGRFLLDTNIVIALFAQDNNVIEQIRRANEVYIPAIVLGELYYGAYNSSRKDENLDRIDQLGLEVSVLACNKGTAKNYGQIKAQLKRKGKPIPENDIWIAAIAFQYDLTLVARDSHFDNISELKVARW